MSRHSGDIDEGGLDPVDLNTAVLTAPVDAADREGPRWIWRDGELVPWAKAVVHVNAVGHASVSSVFEGIKAYRSARGSGLGLFRLDEHLCRFLDSARICRLRLGYDLDRLRAAVLDLICANEYDDDIYLRPWAFPAGIIKDPLVPADVPCHLVIDSWPFTTGLGVKRGCRAGVSSWRRISDAVMPPRIKAFSNYHNGRLAMMEARQNGYDWPIILNERYQVSEGPGACIALVRHGAISTPALTGSVLESITRDTVLKLARDLGLTVYEREVDRTELYLAQEIFFMGTGWEVLPVTEVDGLAVGNGEPGPVTARIEQAYGQVVRGAATQYRAWLTDVPLARTGERRSETSAK